MYGSASPHGTTYLFILYSIKWQSVDGHLRVYVRGEETIPKNSLTSFAEPLRASFERVGPSAVAAILLWERVKMAKQWPCMCQFKAQWHDRLRIRNSPKQYTHMQNLGPRKKQSRGWETNFLDFNFALVTGARGKF